MVATPISKEDLKRPLPDVKRELELHGLESKIEINRDSYCIPHIKIRSAHDAFLGQGFATAQDRPWHMDYDRHRIYKYAGESGVEQDKMTRRFQIGATVRGDCEAINPEARAMLGAYGAGVNAFIKSTSALPVEYTIVGATPERWQPWDCIAVYNARHII